MKKKYEITETKTDFWGNKKYTVTEKSYGGAFAALVYPILILAILLLPSGTYYLISLIIYPIVFPYEFNKNADSFDKWQTDVIKKSFYISFIICIIQYINLYYSEMDYEDTALSIIRKSILGLICYIIALILTFKESYWNNFKKSN